MKNQLIYLINIQECIQAIQVYTQEGKSAFFAEKIIQDAVIRNLEIMGEATKRLSLEIREQYSHIPWRQIAGLRDVVIHDYLKVDLDEIWGIIEIDLPVLKPQINQIIQEQAKENN